MPITVLIIASSVYSFAGGIVLAAVTDGAWGVEAIANFVGMGAVAGFLLIRLESRMAASEKAQNLTTRSNMIVIMSIEQVSQSIKSQAELLLKDLDKHENPNS